jgi:hypothetical protein
VSAGLTGSLRAVFSYLPIFQKCVGRMRQEHHLHLRITVSHTHAPLYFDIHDISSAGLATLHAVPSYPLNSQYVPSLAPAVRLFGLVWCNFPSGEGQSSLSPNRHTAPRPRYCPPAQQTAPASFSKTALHFCGSHRAVAIVPQSHNDRSSLLTCPHP